MKQTELAWAAGFFDGEGCVSAWQNPDKRARIDFSINQNSLEPLIRFRRALSIQNNIRIFREETGNHRRTWSLKVTKLPEIVRIYKLLRPYLTGPKLMQFENALEAHSKNFGTRGPYKASRVAFEELYLFQRSIKDDGTLESNGPRSNNI